MLFETYGNFKNKKCLFIHGMLSTGKAMIPYTKHFNDYYVINVTLDSHHLNSDMIESKMIEAKKILDYLQESNIDELELVHGTSMGAIIAFELARISDINVKHYFFDGGPFFKLPQILINIYIKGIKKLIKSYLSKTKDELLKDESIKDFIKNRDVDFDTIYNEYMTVFNNYLQDDCLKNIQNICYKFEFPLVKDDKLIFFYSKKEPACKCVSKLKKKYPNAKYIIWKGTKHCEYQNTDPFSYAMSIKELIK